MAYPFKILSIFALAFGLCAPLAHAELDKLPDNTGVRSEKSYVYVKPTIPKLSQLYWAIGKFEPSQDEAIDYYMKINECDIFKDYYHNEFEWTKIRESGRKFVVENKKQFPLRFQFIQPIRFTEYNETTKEFSILDKYSLDAARNFELLADGFFEGACGSEDKEIPLYPRGLAVEISRPFTLKTIPVRPDLAKLYIIDKSMKFKSLPAKAQTKAMLYDTRDAYVALQVKIYSYRGVRFSQENYSLAQVMGVLESYEVYADQGLKQLLYSVNLNKKKERSESENILKKKYQEKLRLKKKEQDAKKVISTPVQ